MDTKKMDDRFLDAAAGEAIGANSAADSAAYQRELAGADVAGREVDRDLSETVARLAAGSPHMAPPADLRGRILQATAPVAFKMEDYRKATHDNGKFYRWGFRAAVVFLLAAAGFNMMTQQSLKGANATIAQLQSRQQAEIKAMTILMSPEMQPVSIKSGDNVVARAFIDKQAGTSLLIVPKGTVAEDRAPEVTLTLHDQVANKDITYPAMTISVPSEFIKSSNIQPLETVLHMQNLTPDTTGVRPMIAGIAGIK